MNDQRTIFVDFNQRVRSGLAPPGVEVYRCNASTLDGLAVGDRVIATDHDEIMIEVQVMGCIDGYGYVSPATGG